MPDYICETQEQYATVGHMVAFFRHPEYSYPKPMEEVLLTTGKKYDTKSLT